MKAANPRQLLNRFFDNMGSISKSIYNVYILTVMKWIREEWGALSAPGICNCWKHCFWHESGTSDSQGSINKDLEVFATTADIEPSVKFNRVSIESLLYTVDADVLVEDISMDTLVVSIISDADGALSAVPSEMAEDKVSHTITEQLKVLSISVKIIENRGMLTTDMKIMICLVSESYVSKNYPKWRMLASGTFQSKNSYSRS